MNIQSKLDEIKQYHAKVNQLRSSHTSVATEIKKAIQDYQSEINRDTMLSDQGKSAKMAEARSHYGKEFIKIAQKMKEEYQQSIVKVKIGAETLLNEAPPKPSDTEIGVFNRKLSDLKTQLLLGTNPAESVKSLQDFAASNNEKPYFANQLRQEFPDLAKSIIGIPGADNGVKLSLRDVYSQIDNASLLPEQKEAQSLALSLENAFGQNLFPESSLEMEVIKGAVGQDFARYANRPDHYVDPNETSAE